MEQQIKQLQDQLAAMQTKATNAEAALESHKQDLQNVLQERDQLKGEARAEASKAHSLEDEMRQLRAEAQRAADLEHELREASRFRPGKTVLITRERKLQKLTGRPKTDADPEVGDWLSDIRQHIEELDESQKIDTIMGYLGGSAKDEVKLRPDTERNTADKILHIIETTFKVTDSLASLSQTLYNRTQEQGETVQSYSLALLKLNSKIQKKGGVALDSIALTDKFIEGLLDPSLRRDMRRLNKEHPRLTFVQFREKVLDLVQEDEVEIQKKKTVKTAEVKAESDLAELLKQQMELQKQTTAALTALQQQQQKTDEKVAQLMKQQKPTAGPSQATTTKSDDVRPRSRSRQIGPCFICGKLGHIAKNCWDNPKNKDKRPSSKPTQSKPPAKQEN